MILLTSTLLEFKQKNYRLVETPNTLGVVNALIQVGASSAARNSQEHLALVFTTYQMYDISLDMRSSYEAAQIHGRHLVLRHSRQAPYRPRTASAPESCATQQPATSQQ